MARRTAAPRQPQPAGRAASDGDQRQGNASQPSPPHDPFARPGRLPDGSQACLAAARAPARAPRSPSASRPGQFLHSRGLSACTRADTPSVRPPWPLTTAPGTWRKARRQRHPAASTIRLDRAPRRAHRQPVARTPAPHHVPPAGTLNARAPRRGRQHPLVVKRGGYAFQPQALEPGQHSAVVQAVVEFLRRCRGCHAEVQLQIQGTHTRRRLECPSPRLRHRRGVTVGNQASRGLHAHDTGQGEARQLHGHVLEERTAAPSASASSSSLTNRPLPPFCGSGPGSDFGGHAQQGNLWLLQALTCSPPSATSVLR